MLVTPLTSSGDDSVGLASVGGPDSTEYILFGSARFLADSDTLSASVAALTSFRSKPGATVFLNTAVEDKSLSREVEAMVRDLSPCKTRRMKIQGYEQEEEIPHLEGGLLSMVPVYKQYMEDLQNLDEVLEILASRNAVIARLNLDGSVWGSQAPAQAVDKARENQHFVEGTITLFSRLTAASVKNLQTLVQIMENWVKVDKSLAAIKMPPMVMKAKEDYELAKGMVLDMVALLYPTYSIDHLFRKYTTNPASWFIPSNVLGDFYEAFEKLLEFLNRTPDYDQTMASSFAWASARMR